MEIEVIMKKRMAILLVLLMFSFNGCYKASPEVISGIEKLQRAAEKLNKHNSPLCLDQYNHYKKMSYAAETEKEKEKWNSLANKELQWIAANKKLPVALLELLETLKEQ